jgi:hypothetical protein
MHHRRGQNNGDPYTDMKDAILQFTTKPKWSCYFDLHTLPSQGAIRPSQLMAKLISLMPTDAPTNTDLIYSFFLFRMPQSIREALAATDYPNASMILNISQFFKTMSLVHFLLESQKYKLQKG